jgi:hypothetical protein
MIHNPRKQCIARQQNGIKQEVYVLKVKKNANE